MSFSWRIDGDIEAILGGAADGVMEAAQEAVVATAGAMLVDAMQKLQEQVYDTPESQWYVRTGAAINSLYIEAPSKFVGPVYKPKPGAEAAAAALNPGSVAPDAFRPLELLEARIAAAVHYSPTIEYGGWGDYVLFHERPFMRPVVAAWGAEAPTYIAAMMNRRL